jgi:hypothetical protein
MAGDSEAFQTKPPPPAWVASRLPMPGIRRASHDAKVNGEP